MPLVSVALAGRSRQAEPIHTNERLPELRGGEGEMISLWASGAVSSFKSHGYLLTKTVTTIVSRNNNTAFKTLFYSINSSKCLLALFFSPEMLNLKDSPRGEKIKVWPTEGIFGRARPHLRPFLNSSQRRCRRDRWRRQSRGNHINPLPKNAVKGFWKVGNEPGATRAGRACFVEAVMVPFCFHHR